MKQFFSFLFLFQISILFGQQVIVESPEALNKAIKEAKPGAEIILKNGEWQDIQIRFQANGEKDKPIILKAQTPGKVILTGQSNIKIGGDYLVVQDLYFTDGYTPDKAVIEFKIDNKHIANHSTVTNCVIQNFSQPNRSISDLWVLFWGRHNKLENSYLAGKFNEGPTLRVALDGNEHIKNHHQIINNHFGPRPRKGGPKAETIQIGSSETSMAPSYVLVANNFFEECNGEVEIISNKSSFNEFRNNIFYKSEGSLVLRHGNYCTVDGNIFIGDGENEAYGGIRVINTGHWITNNYFYDLKGDEFRSPLAIMNGIPKSPLNRYNQVTDVVVAYNTFVNSRTPWHISVGANLDRKEVLPASEIRSARPERVLIANNVIYENGENYPVLKKYDKVDGVEFQNNLVSENIEIEGVAGIKKANIKLEKLSDNIYQTIQDETNTVYNGFEFETIDKDIFGISRNNLAKVGAFIKNSYSSKELPNIESFGPDWFVINQDEKSPKNIQVATVTEFLKEVQNAPSGSIIQLKKGRYEINESIQINKALKIEGEKGVRLNLKLNSSTDKVLFTLNPEAQLEIKNLEISGTGDEVIFATQSENMKFPYSLDINNLKITDFHTLLKAYQHSFADNIHITNSEIEKGKFGLLLNAETDDLGDYNAEFVKIKNSIFNKIENVIIDYYRGGYDESTIGGNLIFEGNTVTNSGFSENNNVLIKNRGIVNVDLINNSFKNNEVELVALLWGEVGNTSNGNEVQNSGEIKTEQHLKQKLVY